MQSIKGINKVSEESIFKKYFPHLAALIIFIMVLIIFVPSHKAIKENEALNKNDINSTTLHDNLNALKGMNMNQDQPDQLNTHYAGMTHMDTRSNKTMLAKQNAPTLLYHQKVSFSDSEKTTTNTSQSVLNDGSSYAHFANSATVAKAVSAKKLAHTGYTVAGGEFVHATLETAINSNLPGMVRAIVSRPVYSYTGERIIIPAGSRLIGQYASNTMQGINRVFVIWNRVILPHGITAELNSPGTDQLGTAGQGADVYNTHFFARFGNAALLSIIGAAASTGGVNPNEQYNSASQYRIAIGASFQQSAQSSLKQSANIKPTLQVFQGASINVFISRDISFYSVMHHEN